MKHWLLVRLIMIAVVAPVAVAFVALGYLIDWPTLIYTLLVVAVVDAVRESTE